MCNLKHLTAIVIFFTLLTACGFKKSHPTAFPLEIQPLSLQTQDPYGTLAKNLQAQLVRFKIAFTFNQPQNRFSLGLQEHPVTERILTISTNTRIRQVRLEYVISYTLAGPSGETILPTTKITVVRIHNENLDKLLGSHHDRQVVEEEMKKDAISMLLTEINSKKASAAMQKYFHPDYYES